MKFKDTIRRIKDEIDTDTVKSTIQRDLNLNFKNQKCLCILHKENNPSMSYYKEGKFFKCHSCGGTYDIFNHYQLYYNIGFIEAANKIITDFRLNIDTIKKVKKNDLVSNTVAFKHDDDISKVEQYLLSRGIDSSTVKYAGIKSYKGNIVFEYRNEYGIHVTNKYRPARIVNKEEPKMWFQKNTSTTSLFNMDKVDITKPLVITEGEIDCLSIIQSGIKNVVSIPTGVNSVNKCINHNWEWLEQIEEIILWFDNDNAGKKGMKEVSSRLSNSKIKLIISEKCKDANEILTKFGEEGVREEIEKAITPPVEDIITFEKIENFNVFEAEKIKSGFDIVDSQIYGFVLGTLSIVSGKNGSGKSTLINQMCICEPVKQGYSVFVFSGELTRSNLKYWITQTMTNEVDIEEARTLEGIKYYKSTKSSADIISKYLDDKIYIYDNDIDNSGDNILLKMEQVAKRFGCKVFVIDNLMMIDMDSNDNNLYANQKNLIIKLKRFAIKYNAVVHLVAHHRKTQESSITKDDIYGSSNISNLADYIIRLERLNKEENSSEYDAVITILKNRPTANQDKKIGLFFSNKRKRFYRTQLELNKDYGYSILKPTQIEFNK